MIQKKYALLLGLVMFAAAGSLAGCGSSSTTAANQPAVAKAVADVTISAKFPAADGAVKSLIPSGAQLIEVYARSMPYVYDQNNPNGTLLATLTPAAATKSVKMAPGSYLIEAVAYDSADPLTRTILSRTSTGGEVQMNVSNAVNLTFLEGQWTLVNSSDVPTPLELSNGTKLNDFVVGGEQYNYKLAKSSLDPSKPMGGGGGVVRMRFDNNTSARTYGWMASQFVGATSSTFIGSDSYNLTKKCTWDSYYGLPCDEKAGDQVVMISGKDNGDMQHEGSPGEGNLLYGSAEALLPNKGQTTFTQNGAPLDLMAAIPDSTVTGGNLITGGIIEWKPSTDRVVTLGTPAAAKVAKTAKTVKAQSTNTAYTNMTVKDVETVVCSGSNPQNRGTWSFANNSSAGKVVIGSKVCYTNYPYLSQQYNPVTFNFIVDAGDYSYGLVPANTSQLGDYCHQWDFQNNTCLQQLPGNGDVYQPWNFRAVKTATKTAIDYGSFKFNFWSESNQTGTAYLYQFRAKGSTTVTPAK